MRNKMPNSKKSKRCKNKSMVQRQKLINLSDFKIQNGQRRYKGEWMTASNKIITKWTNMAALKSYHMALRCFQLKQRQYISLHEESWRNMIDSGEASESLQCFQLNPNFFYKKGEIISQQDEQDSKDSDFIIKQKRIQKPRNKTQKAKIIDNPKSKQSSKQINPSIENIGIRKEETPNSDNNQPQAPFSKDNPIITKEGREETSNNHINSDHIEQSLKQADKETGQLLSPYVLHDSEAGIINQSGKKQNRPLEQYQQNKSSLSIKQLKQEYDNMLEVSSSLQSSSQNDVSHILQRRRKIDFGSESSFQQSNSQPSYAYQPSVDYSLNFSQLKQLIKINLNIPTNKVKNDQSHKIQFLGQADANNIKMRERQSLKVQVKIQQKTQQKQQVQQDHQYKQLKLVDNFSQLFKCYFDQKIIREEECLQQIYEIKGTFNFGDLQFFEVNIGNSYYEQIRFISYQTIKQKHHNLLTKWLKSHNYPQL